MTCREERGAGGWVPPPIANVVYQSYLCHQASIKAQKDRVQRASKLVHTWRSGKSGHCTGTDTAPLPHTLPCASLPSGCCELEAFRIKSWSSNLTIFLSSGSCCSKLIKPEEWVVGTSGLRLVSQKQVTPWICNWHLKWEGGDSTVELIWYSLHADGVTTEPNWKGPEDITKLHHVWKPTSGVRGGEVVMPWQWRSMISLHRLMVSKAHKWYNTVGRVAACGQKAVGCRASRRQFHGALDSIPEARLQKPKEKPQPQKNWTGAPNPGLIGNKNQHNEKA